MHAAYTIDRLYSCVCVCMHVCCQYTPSEERTLYSMHASVSKPFAGQVILYQAPEILAPIIIPLIGFLLHAVGNFKASRCVQVLSCMGACHC